MNGEKTGFKDREGTEIYIGDTVELLKPSVRLSERGVIKRCQVAGYQYVRDRDGYTVPLASVNDLLITYGQ